jgi:hypothetical protein
MTESKNPQAKPAPDEQIQEIREVPLHSPIVPQEQKKRRWKLPLPWPWLAGQQRQELEQRRLRQKLERQLLRQELDQRRLEMAVLQMKQMQRMQWLRQRRLEQQPPEEVLQTESLEQQPPEEVLQTQQQALSTQQQARKLLQELHRRGQSSSWPFGDLVVGGQDPSLDVQAQRDVAFYDEVRRAVGRGAPTLLLGTSTRSLDRSLAKLTAVHRKDEAGEQSHMAAGDGTTAEH